MRTRLQAWAGPAREAVATLLAAVLFLQVALSGGGALRAASPAFDPLGALCSAHADPAALLASTSDRGSEDAPDPRHALCCLVVCGSCGSLPSVLPLAVGLPSAPPVRAAPVPERWADPLPCPAWLRGGRRARAPPVIA